MDEPTYRPTITLEEQLAAAERELKYRQRVYPRRIAKGQMSINLARHETAAMEAIIETLGRMVPGARLL